QAASTRLGFSVKKTMTLAQRLYEAGYITYMRTDSTNLSQDALESVRQYIDKHLGEAYLPAQPRLYSSKEGAQEAHEAIRPSDVRLKASDLASMEPDAQRLYDLIWRRFVACQINDAEFTSTSISVSAGTFELRTRGRVMRFDGHLKVLAGMRKGEEDVLLPDVFGRLADRAGGHGQGRGRCAAHGCALRRPAEPDRPGTQATLTQADTALLRSCTGKRTGKTRVRPPVHLRLDYFHHSGTSLCQPERPAFLCRKNGRYRYQPAGRKLQRTDGFWLHRQHGRTA